MQKQAAKFDSLFRQLTPLFLLLMLLAVAFERWLPYREWMTFNFGDDIVLKVAVLFLTGYVLLLWGESLRLQGLLTGLLEAFKTFDREHAAEAQAGGKGGGAGAGKKKGKANPQARLEAAKLLIAAMGSDDASIVETSHHNLVRLVGTDLGKDPARWQQWLKSQEGQ